MNPKSTLFRTSIAGSHIAYSSTTSLDSITVKLLVQSQLRVCALQASKL